ncbi:MAG: type II toxin-antitoxin system Phd/YefM family antitoxin [Geminicoccaceae bacterium]
MRTMAAKEAKDKFGALLDAARREPVTIARKGRPVVVVLSIEDYERLEALEDAYWAERAAAAEQEGLIGAEEGEKLLSELLNAQD